MPAPPTATEILVVDDDPETRAAFVAVLERAGHRVREAADGHACLRALEEAAPQLVLLDVSMPGMDGFETLTRIRSGACRDVPVILLTGHRLDAESIGSGLELGAEEYLCKPVRPDELTARIRALVHLHAARKELEALKRDQTAMLVHDLKQPLAIISLRAEFIADEAQDPEIRRSGVAIRDACRQMEQLVSSVLELSRLEAGQLPIQRAPGRLSAIVSDLVEQLRGLAERRGIALGYAAASDDGEIALDHAKIAQVVQNLIGNALKFTPAGGRIDVRVERRGSQLAVLVEDTGCGLAPGDAARIFETWHQTGAGRASGGTGLGLAIARAVVEAHGGTIGAGARTDGQRGACFWFLLPGGARPAASVASHR